MKKIIEFSKKLDHVDGGGGEVHAARVLQEIFQDVAEAIGFPAQGIKPLEGSMLEVRLHASVFDHFSQQRGIQSNGGQRVANFVGQSAGHGSNLGHPLRAAGSGLLFLQGGPVSGLFFAVFVGRQHLGSQHAGHRPQHQPERLRLQHVFAGH